LTWVEICQDDPERERECLYYLAIGYFKIGAYMEARRCNDGLLLVEPDNRQAQELKRMVDNKVTREGLLGMAIVGGVVSVVGYVVMQFLKKK
jgi:fission 1 protein